MAVTPNARDLLTDKERSPIFKIREGKATIRDMHTPGPEAYTPYAKMIIFYPFQRPATH